MKHVHAFRNRGVTLIELMVTLAVAVILLAMAVPSFIDYFDKARARGAADQIASLLATARGEAVRLDRDVSVSLAGTTGTWCLGANQATDPVAGQPVPEAAACDCSTAPASCLAGGRELVITSADYQGVTIDAVDLDVTFDGKLGTLAGLTTDQVTVTSPKGAYEVRVDVTALGHARSCVPSGQRAINGVPAC